MIARFGLALCRIALHATDMPYCSTAGTAGVDRDGSTANVHVLAATVALAEAAPEVAPHVRV